MDFSSKITLSNQLSQQWNVLIGVHTPDQRQFLNWIIQYDQPTIERGFERTAVWFAKESRRRKHGKPEIDQREVEAVELVKYASGVMSAMKRSRVEQAVSRG